MENEFLTQDEIKSIALLRASVGPHDTAVEIDPYYDAVNWHDAARCDGRTYSGVVEMVTRNEGESFADFYARCESRANELND